MGYKVNTTLHPASPAMAVLGWAPHWGFVVVFMRGLRRAGLPLVVRGGAARVLPRPRHVPATSATCERSTVLVHLFLDAAGPSGFREGPAALHIQWSRFPGIQFPGTWSHIERSLEHRSQGHRPQDHRSRNKSPRTNGPINTGLRTTGPRATS